MQQQNMQQQFESRRKIQELKFTRYFRITEAIIAHNAAGIYPTAKQIAMASNYDINVVQHILHKNLMELGLVLQIYCKPHPKFTKPVCTYKWHSDNQIEHERALQQQHLRPNTPPNTSPTFSEH